MQTICQKCGHGNLLGHLFCVKCGVKLDLSHVDEDMEDEVSSTSRATAIKSILMLIVILLVAVLGVAGWPQRAFDDGKLDNGTPSRIENALVALNMVAGRPNTTLTTTPPIEQLDANAWLASANSSENIRSVSVSFKRNRLVYRTCLVLKSYEVWVVVTPKIPLTIDLVCKPENNSLKVAGAQVGHLPIPGPLAKYVAALVRKTFRASSREKTVFEGISEIKIDEGQLSVTVTGK